MPLIDPIPLAAQSIPFHNLMSLTLIDLGELRRAIPFCEQGVQQLLDKNELLAAAELLAREGVCYIRCGLKEQGAVPLRAAVKILRNHPGDPRLASTLISLGNALRKSTPDEAERLYKEAAEIHEAKGQFESAAPAWVNLGILCSEQRRDEEALDWYGRALRLREGSPGTPPERLALLLNNMAGARRRMGDFAEALHLVDRALPLLKKDDGRMLAHVYGTRGQVLHDAGQDEEALVWLQKSYAERRKSSSPDLDSVAEILGFEIDCLRRLGRVEETAAAEERLAAVHREKADAPQATLAMGEVKEQAPGSVMVELPFGTRPGSRYYARDAELVAEQLGTILAMGNVGKYGGRVTIPESTTLWFHGEDSEAMFAAMEQYLSDHAVCAGAVITIRQGQRVRELVIPQLTN
jgi:tetratricopeptide (TPR) repeat protein